MVLDAEPTAAHATLPSGNALNDYQGWTTTGATDCLCAMDMPLGNAQLQGITRPILIDVVLLPDAA
jgi:hypothetical protein